MKVRVLIDGAEYEFEREHLTDYHYESHCLVCPICLRIWAQVQVDGGTTFWAYTVSCERCPWHTLLKPGIPGSLLEQGVHQHVDRVFIEAMPRALLEREFRVHLKAYGVSLDVQSPRDKFLEALARKRGTALASSARETFEPIIANTFIGGSEPPSGS